MVVRYSRFRLSPESTPNDSADGDSGDGTVPEEGSPAVNEGQGDLWNPAPWGKVLLQTSGLVASIPWESFLLQSLMTVLLCVGFPFIWELVWEYNREHGTIAKMFASSKTITEANLQRSHQSSCADFYPPMGVLAGCVFACIMLTLYMVMAPAVRRRSARVIWVDLLAPMMRCLRKERKFSEVQLCLVYLYVFVLSCLPIVAWYARSDWNDRLSQYFHSCARECHPQDSVGLNHPKCMVQFRETCGQVFLKNVTHDTCLRDVSIRGWFPAPPDSLFDNVSHLGCSCFNVLQHMNDTYFIKRALKARDVYNAFVPMVRNDEKIGILELYGSALSVVYLLAMFCSRIALCSKLEALRSAKQELVYAHFLSDSDNDKYRRLFERLYRTVAGNRKEAKSWLLDILRRGSEGSQDVSMDADDAYNEAYNEAGQAWKARLLGLIYSGVNVAIPGLLRMTAISGESQPFWAKSELAPSLKLNAAVAFFFNYLWFSWCVQSYYAQKDKLQVLFAFDCLWRFPDEHPLRTTFRGNQPLRKERTRETLPKFDRGGYWADFHGLQGKELVEEMEKLEQWLQMRTYLQLDSFDERIAMELAMLVALIAMLPKLMVVCFNVYFMLDWKALEVQSINFVALWNCTVVVALVVTGLINTLTFNDLYDGHHRKLSRLIEYTRMELSRTRAPLRERFWTHEMSLYDDDDEAVELDASPRRRSLDVSPGRKSSVAISPGRRSLDGQLVDPEAEGYVHRSNETLAWVEAVERASRSMDMPSTFFGMKVSRRLITGFVSANFLYMAPQVYAIINKLKQK